LGVGWITTRPSDGVVDWTQSETGDQWQQAWYSEDGLRQATSTVQRAIIDGYDPAKPIRFRARSRAITTFKPYSVVFGAPVLSQDRRLPALTRPRGGDILPGLQRCPQPRAPLPPAHGSSWLFH